MAVRRGANTAHVRDQLGQLMHVKGRQALPFVLGVGKRNRKTLATLTDALNATPGLGGFTQKTVRRYLEELTHLGADLQTVDEGRTRWYYLSRPYPILNDHTLSEGMALALLLTFRAARDGLPPDVLEEIASLEQVAKKRLQRGTTRGLREWPQKVQYIARSSTRGHRPVDERVRAVVYEAVIEKRPLDCEYRSLGNEQPRSMQISPLGLMFREQRCYVVCYLNDHSWERPRALPLVRFASARINEAAKFVAPAGFSLERFVAERNPVAIQQGTAPLALRIRVAPHTARWLEEQPLAEDQTVAPLADTDWREIRATVPDDSAIRSFLRALGEDCEVLEPPELLEEFKRLGRILARFYPSREGN